MGETSADIQRDIERIRDDVAATVAELERRARRTVNLKAQAQDHPTAVGVLGFGLAAGLVVGAYSAISSYRESRRPVNRLKDEAEDRWQAARERARRRLPVRVELGGKKEKSVDTAQNPGMVKSILWAALTAAVVALFGLLARRVSAAVWQSVMKEPPPTSKV